MADRHKQLFWAASVGAVVFLCGLQIAEWRAEYNSLHMRPATHDEAIERNMSQSGVDDVTIPLQTRQEYARKHGLKVPTR